MNAPHFPAAAQQASTSLGSVFGPEARKTFAKNYPEVPHSLAHELSDHPLLQLAGLAELGTRLPKQAVEYNRGDLPIGVDGKPGSNGLTIGDTISNIRDSNSWAVLKNVEQDPSYQALLLDLLSELQPAIEAKTGAMLTPQAFIFVSSPEAVTPYHFDPEHNILLQITGTKTMNQFPAGDARFAPDQTHESYHLGGPRELIWDDGFAEHGTAFELSAGKAVYVPVMAPHFVRNGPQHSISLSITWRSEWSYAEAGARCFNSLLRRAGITPAAPKRWPGSNVAKDVAFRAYRRCFGPPQPQGGTQP